MRVAIVTGSRADWNGLSAVAKCLIAQQVDVTVIAIGQHADDSESLKSIIADGFDPRVVQTNYKADMAVGCGRAVIAMANALSHDLPDWVLVLGDRYEILGAASAAALLDIPVAHIGGGDITEGSVDNKLRYAITALADLHFTTNEYSHRRVFNQIREEGGYIGHYQVGNPAIDRLQDTKVIPREQLFRQLKLKESKNNILVAYHAATRDPDPATGCIEMCKALHKFSDTSFLVLGTNSDRGSGEVTWQLQHFIKSASRAVLRNNLLPEEFYNAMFHFNCMVGNSSAGIVESASFGIPVVNIGWRQAGRTVPGNVVSVGAKKDEIAKAISLALTQKHRHMDNPYGDGQSAERIAKIMVGQLVKEKRYA